MKTFLGATLGLLLCTIPAQAGWDQRPTPGHGYLTAVSAIDPNHVFVAGVRQSGGMIPQFEPLASFGDDGGRLWTDRSGALGVSASFDMVTAAHLFDAQRAWLSVGSRILRTTDGGESWSATTGIGAHAIHFVSPRVGFAGGKNGALRFSEDGGATWNPLESPVSTTIRGFRFADEHRGWAWAHDENDDGIPSGAVLLRTTDGGRSWSKGTDIGTGGISSVHFFCDGTGWIAGWTMADEQSWQAWVRFTGDGGRTSVPVAVPMQVGTMQAFGQSRPIETGRILAMHWDDKSRGQLAGVAHVIRLDGSEGTNDIWRVVDYVTDDGGASWTKTNVGTIAVNLFNPPPSDGTFIAGTMLDAFNGFLVGSSGAVRGLEKICATTADCGREGYHCDEDSRCVRDEQPACEPCGTDEQLVDGDCVPVGGPPGDGGPGSNQPGTDEPIEETGCDCASAPAGMIALLGLAMLRRRRD